MYFYEYKSLFIKCVHSSTLYSSYPQRCVKQCGKYKIVGILIFIMHLKNCDPIVRVTVTNLSHRILSLNQIVFSFQLGDPHYELYNIS